jgi:hypothetical protein
MSLFEIFILSVACSAAATIVFHETNERPILTYDTDREYDNVLPQPRKFSNYPKIFIFEAEEGNVDNIVILETNKGQKMINLRDINVISSNEFTLNGETYQLNFDRDGYFHRFLEQYLEMNTI